ncbi:hypothetical protein LCGC14_0843170, partial [marine sediment metagenome]
GREGLSGIRSVVMTTFGKVGGIRTWFTKHFATSINSEVYRNNEVSQKINEETNAKKNDKLLKQDKVNSWKKIIGAGLLGLLLSVIAPFFTGSFKFSNFLSMMGTVSQIEGFYGNTVGRYQTLEANAQKRGRNANFQAMRELKKLMDGQTNLAKSKIKDSNLQQDYLEKNGVPITDVNNHPKLSNPMFRDSLSVIERVGVATGSTSEGLVSIDRAGRPGLGQEKRDETYFLERQDKFLQSMGNRERLRIQFAKANLEDVSGVSQTVKIGVEDLSSKDREVFDQLTREINDVGVWDGISNIFTLPDDPALTIDGALHYIRRKLGINPKATMFFSSETYGTLDYISHKDKKTFSKRTIELNNEKITIGPETKFNVIKKIGDLKVRFTLENQLNDIDGYSEARELLSFLVGGSFNFERLASTDEEALIMSKLIKGGDEWGGLENYADRFLQETGLYSQASKSYKASLEAGLFAYTFRMFADKSLIDQIVAACSTSEQANQALKNYKKLIASVFSVQFKSLLDTTTHSQALEYMRENAKILMANYILEKIGASKKVSQNGISIYEGAQKFEEFMKDPQQIQAFESEFLLKFFKSKDGILKQLSKGFFDSSVNSIPHITKTVQMLIGRTQESNDFFGGFPDRLVSEFIKSDFKMPKAFKGINYGGAGSILDINKFITKDTFTNIEESLLGVSKGWSQEFQRFSEQTPSDRRFFDNLLVSFAGAYLSSPNKGSFGELSWASKVSVVNDLISTEFSTIFTELKDITKLKGIKDFKATIAIGADGDSDILSWMVQKLFTERDSLKDFTQGSDPEKLKTPSKYSFLFSITDWINSEAKLSDYSTKTEAIFAVNEFFYTFKDKYHENYGQLKVLIKSIANKFYKSKYINSMGNNFLRAIERLFTNDNFLNDMVQPTIDGGYQILWEDHFNILIEVLGGDGKSVELSRAYIPESYNGEPVHILRNNEWVAITSLESGYLFDSAYIYVYRITESDKIQVGLARVDDIKNDFSHLPFELHEGFPTTDGGVLHDIWVSNSEGGLLLSDVDLYDFSIRSDDNKYWYKEYFTDSGQPLRNLFIGYIFNSGQKMTAYLQKLELNVEMYSPTVNFFPDIPIRDISHLRESKFKFSPLTGIDRTEAYGKDFTMDTVNKIVYDLFDPSRGWKKQMFQQQLLKYLPQLNGYFKGGLNGKFTLGSGLETINAFVKELSFSKDELQRFAWKNPDGTFIGAGQYVKEWLDLIYIKITSYYLEGGQNSVINNEAKKLLRMADPAYPSHTPLSVVTYRETFTVSESKMGNEIFRSASSLFGHFTIRLMLSNMVNFNPDKTIIFLSRPTKLKDLSDIHYHVGFVATRLLGDAPIPNYKNTPNSLQHMMGAFFLDSHVYLPLTSGVRNSRDNAYIFDFGPILIEGTNQIQAKISKSLSWKIATKLANQYQGLNMLKTLFYKSQDNLFKTLESQIIKKIIDGDFTGDKDKNIWLAEKLINQARKELFTLANFKSSNLRKQIELQLLDSSTNLIKLEFKGISSMPSITLDFAKKLFRNSDFMTWGYIDQHNNKWNGMIDYKNKLIDTNVQNMVKLLTRLIAEHGSGKVIILPMKNTNDERLGYRHYYSHQTQTTKWLPLINSYFEVDLSNSASALSQLIHIGYSLQAHDTAYIVKEWVDIEQTYGDIEEYLQQNKEMICAFDYRGFLKKDEIYVGDPTFFGDPILPRAPIIIEDYSTAFYDDQTMFTSYLNQWKNSFINNAGMTVVGPQSDFVRYINKIMTGTSEFAMIMYDILFGPRPDT